MAGYFLIVHDIVQFASGAGIWCQGRGSAANSVICYVLGITAVDPIKHKLLFERFLSVERAEAPDIDIDFENARREEVIQYVYRRWGRTHAAQVANVITYRPRLAVRDAARALGYATGHIDEMTRHIQHHEPPGEDSGIPRDVVELAAQLDGLPRHLGVHSGGMVLTRRPVGEFMPVEWATAEGRSVLQGDKDDAEEAGLVKIDLLGLGMLSALHTACDLIGRHHGRTYDLASIPPDDPDVYAMITGADTVGLFQVESRAQMSTLPRLRPASFADLVVAVSLIRPGPIQGGSVHPYLRRRAGREKVTYPHPLAQPALERTLGVPLYQEQMMRLAMDCAGFGPGDADQLRKALAAKRAPERVGKLRARLMDGMAARGIPAKAADELYTMIEAFSGYGFPESHSQSLAHIVYASAWLKLRYPAAYLAGILANQPMGFYSPATLIGDARRRGITVRGVDVTRSSPYADLETDPDSTGGRAVRLGLTSVRGLSEETAQTIADSRPYADLEDFARRTRLPLKVLENLATADAFTGFDVSRREALWAAGALATADESLLPGHHRGTSRTRTACHDSGRGDLRRSVVHRFQPRQPPHPALPPPPASPRSAARRGRTRTPRRRGPDDRRTRHPPPAPAHGQGHLLPQHRGRDRHGQRHRPATGLGRPQQDGRRQRRAARPRPPRTHGRRRQRPRPPPRTSHGHDARAPPVISGDVHRAQRGAG